MFKKVIVGDDGLDGGACPVLVVPRTADVGEMPATAETSTVTA
jgi:hypothetical protein